MNLLAFLPGFLAGLGVFVAMAQLIPSGPWLDAALARIQPAGPKELELPPSRALGRWS